MQNFSDRLAEAIFLSGKSKGALATSTGVALSTVSRWLGGTTPKAETLEKIAKFLGVDAKWLLTGDSSPSKSGESDSSEPLSEFLDRVRPVLKGIAREQNADLALKVIFSETSTEFISRMYEFENLIRLVFQHSEHLQKYVKNRPAEIPVPNDILQHAAGLDNAIYQLLLAGRKLIDEHMALRELAKASPAAEMARPSIEPARPSAAP